MKSRISEYDCSAAPNNLSATFAVYAHATPGTVFEDLFVETKYGIVAGYRDRNSCSLIFIVGGRKHRRNINGVKTRKHIITLARRFAAEKAGVQ
jgi:hypothetical protein